MTAGIGGIEVDGTGASDVEIVSVGSAPGNVAVSQGAISGASASLAVDTYKVGKMMRTLTFDGSMSAAPSAGDVINIRERALNVSGTSDENIPDASYPGRLVGQFVLDPGQTAQIIVSSGILIKPYDVEYYFECATTTVNIAASWKVLARHYSVNATQV